MAKKKSPESASRLNLSALLTRGYFPIELPPPFTAASFAKAVSVSGDLLPEELTAPPKKGQWCDYCAYSLARPASLRRRLALADPVPYYRLASAIIEHQDELLPKGALFNILSPKTCN